MAKRDADAELKLRVARYLWSLGYVCPTEVVMSGREIVRGESKRFDLTDLDVLGIKFENDLTWHTVIADCKTGAKTSTVNRIFWLRGVVDFFGARRGYLAMPSMGPEAREVAIQLEVTLLDEANLSRYESAKGLDHGSLLQFSIDGYDRFRALWGVRLPKGQLPDDDERKLIRLYQFLSYRYWFQHEYLNVQQTVTEFADAGESIRKLADRQRAKTVAYRGLTQLALSLLKMCGTVMATKPDEVHNEVRRYIFGGASNALERNRLMKLLASISKTPVPLEPPYYESLLELTNRLIAYSHFAKDIPRYAEIALSETIVGSRVETIEAMLGAAYSVDTLKLTKDVASFLCASSGIEIALFDDLMHQ